MSCCEKNNCSAQGNNCCYPMPGGGGHCFSVTDEAECLPGTAVGFEWCGGPGPGPTPSPTPPGPTPSPTPPGPSPSKGLPIGALIGIIVGGCMILGIIIALILHKKK